MTKVSLVRCRDYDPGRVYDAVKRSIDLLGGIGSFVESGMKVLLKPNLLSARTPEEAVDTHPEVVRAVARLAKGAGAKVMIGDSPGGYGNNWEEVIEKSGMRKVAGEEGVELVKFSISKTIDGIPIARQVFDSNVIISIPKFKTHSVTIITGAVKNTYGVMPGLVKAGCHSRAPKEEEFARIVAKVYSIVRPHLTVVDGVVAMEGDGPSAGDPRKMGFLVASRDGVAIDACLARMLVLEPLDILTTKEAHELGCGEADMSRIEIAGDDITNFITPDFRLPQTTPLKFIPKTVARALANLVRFRPWIDERVCTRCNLCKIACPVNAITIEKRSSRIDYKKCVKCLCCHEVCPYKAVSIKRNIVTKMIWG